MQHSNAFPQHNHNSVIFSHVVSLQLKARADDRWEEYSTVVAPPHPAVAASLPSEEPQRSHSKKSQHSRDNSRVLPDEGLRLKSEEGVYNVSTTQDGSRGHTDAALEKRHKVSPSPSASLQLHQQKMGLSSIALDSVIHRFVLCSLFSVLCALSIVKKSCAVSS